MCASLRLRITCLIVAATAQATVIGGTSITQPLRYNELNTYTFIFGGPGPQLAVRFTPLTGFHYTLSSAFVPVRSYGPSEVAIDIYDTIGINPGTKLEGLTVLLPPQFGYHLVGGNFSGSTVLHGGQQYFFCVSDRNGSGQIDWARSVPDLGSTIYYTTNTGFWNQSQSLTSPAFQVISLGASAPEPGTIRLLGTRGSVIDGRQHLEALGPVSMRIVAGGGFTAQQQPSHREPSSPAQYL